MGKAPMTIFGESDLPVFVVVGGTVLALLLMVIGAIWAPGLLVQCAEEPGSPFVCECAEGRR